MSNHLTDRSFWSQYWESKTGLAVAVGKNYPFHRQLEEVVNQQNVHTAIELGGFPGYYAIFLSRYFGVKSTLLDYFIHPDVVRQVLAANNMLPGDIEQVEADLFAYQPTQHYDLVLSCGLIEHFEDTEDIIARHVAFLAPGGTLFITLPNFRGVNGWVQRTFDPSNYAKHNIASMDPHKLAGIAKKLGLKEVTAGYDGKFSVWLENKSEKSAAAKALVRLIWLAGKVITRLIPVESKALSPYIVLKAKS